MIKWVVFDLGDVVLKRTTALPALSALMGTDPDGFTKAYFEHRPVYDRDSDAANFWSSIASGTGSAVPDETTIAELVTKDDIGWSELEPESHRLIIDVADSGVALAVLSNAPSSMGRLVERAPWASAFQRLFFSGDLGLLKPDGEIYLHLMANLGVEPQEVAFLDDRADNIAGATAAGIHGFVFTGAAQARTDLRSIGVTIPER